MLLDERQLELAGRAAYEAYRMGKPVGPMGEALPPWGNLRREIREAWRTVADAAVMVATVSLEPLPPRWGKGPETSAERADEAHARVRVVADDSDGDEMPGAGVDA
jgi:hypothetical protein